MGGDDRWRGDQDPCGSGQEIGREQGVGHEGLGADGGVAEHASRCPRGPTGVHAASRALVLNPSPETRWEASWRGAEDAEER